MAHYERFELHNSEGQRIVGSLDLPSSGPSQPAVLVLCHGYGGTRQGKHLRAISAALTEAGVPVVRFDFADGAGESDGELASGSVRGYVDDLETVLDFVERHPQLSGRAVALGGHSYAGMVILVVAAQRPEIAGVFFLSGVFDFTKDFEMEQIARRVKAPIYVIHGESDREVSLAHPEALRRAAGERIKLWKILPSTDHNYLLGNSAAIVAETVRDELLALATRPRD